MSNFPQEGQDCFKELIVNTNHPLGLRAGNNGCTTLELFREFINCELRTNINERDNNGSTLLDLAIETHSYEAAMLLIEAGADLHVKLCHPSQLIVYSPFYSYVDMIKVLINRGLDPNTKSPDGTSPLIIAVKYNLPVERAIEIIDVLIKTGADVNAVDIRGMTALTHCLDVNPYYQIAEKLINCGADVNIAGIHRSNLSLCLARLVCKIGDQNIKLSPLGLQRHHYSHQGIAIEETEFDTKTLNLLIQSGVDVKCPYVSGQSAIVTYIDTCAQVKKDVDIDIVKILLEAGVTASVFGYDGSSHLIQIILSQKKTLDLIKLLVQYGGISQIRRHFMRILRAISCADMQNEHVDLIKYLLGPDVGANVNASYSLSSTEPEALPLNLVIGSFGEYRIMDIIEEFIKVGLNVNMLDNNNISPLHVAIYRYLYNRTPISASIIMKLIDVGYNPHPLTIDRNHIDKYMRLWGNYQVFRITKLIDCLDNQMNMLEILTQFLESDEDVQIINYLLRAGAAITKDCIFPSSYIFYDDNGNNRSLTRTFLDSYTKFMGNDWNQYVDSDTDLDTDSNSRNDNPVDQLYVDVYRALKSYYPLISFDHRSVPDGLIDQIINIDRSCNKIIDTMRVAVLPQIQNSPMKLR